MRRGAFIPLKERISMNIVILTVIFLLPLSTSLHGMHRGAHSQTAVLTKQETRTKTVSVAEKEWAVKLICSHLNTLQRHYVTDNAQAVHVGSEYDFLQALDLNAAEYEKQFDGRALLINMVERDWTTLLSSCFSWLLPSGEALLGCYLENTLIRNVLLEQCDDKVRKIVTDAYEKDTNVRSDSDSAIVSEHAYARDDVSIEAVCGSKNKGKAWGLKSESVYCAECGNFYRSEVCRLCYPSNTSGDLVYAFQAVSQKNQDPREIQSIKTSCRTLLRGNEFPRIVSRPITSYVPYDSVITYRSLIDDNKKRAGYTYKMIAEIKTWQHYEELVSDVLTEQDFIVHFSHLQHQASAFLSEDNKLWMQSLLETKALSAGNSCKIGDSNFRAFFEQAKSRLKNEKECRSFLEGAANGESLAKACLAIRKDPLLAYRLGTAQCERIFESEAVETAKELSESLANFKKAGSDNERTKMVASFFASGKLQKRDTVQFKNLLSKDRKIRQAYVTFKKECFNHIIGLPLESYGRLMEQYGLSKDLDLAILGPQSVEKRLRLAQSYSPEAFRQRKIESEARRNFSRDVFQQSLRVLQKYQGLPEANALLRDCFVEVVGHLKDGKAQIAKERLEFAVVGASTIEEFLPHRSLLTKSGIDLVPFAAGIKSKEQWDVASAYLGKLVDTSKEIEEKFGVQDADSGVAFIGDLARCGLEQIKEKSRTETNLDRALSDAYDQGLREYSHVCDFLSGFTYECKDQFVKLCKCVKQISLLGFEVTCLRLEGKYEELGYLYGSLVNSVVSNIPHIATEPLHHAEDLWHGLQIETQDTKTVGRSFARLLLDWVANKGPIGKLKEFRMSRLLPTVNIVDLNNRVSRKFAEGVTKQMFSKKGGVKTVFEGLSCPKYLAQQRQIIEKIFEKCFNSSPSLVVHDEHSMILEFLHIVHSAGHLEEILNAAMKEWSSLLATSNTQDDERPLH